MFSFVVMRGPIAEAPQEVVLSSSQKIDELVAQNQGGEGANRSNNQSVKKRGGKIVKDKSTTHVSNMFAALDDGKESP